MSTRVYIGRLSYDVRERDLERFFKGFGRIREILIKNGFGFVEFDDYRDADDAVYELNGKELMGERVIVKLARRPVHRNIQFGYRRRPYRINNSSRISSIRTSSSGNVRYGPPTRTEYRLIVENLSSRVSWQDLKDFMRQAGEVTYADAHKQRRNEGVVEFASYADMKTAIEKLDNVELNGRRIKLNEDKSRRRKSHSRSRSRSQSKSRSRSRSRSKSHSKSRSKSKSRTPSRSRSRSKSRSKSPSRSKSRSVSRSPRQSRSKSRSPSREKSKSKSKSPSPSNSPEKEASPKIEED